MMSVYVDGMRHHEYTLSPPPSPPLLLRIASSSCSGQASISTQGLDLLNGLLGLDPAKRTSAAEALGHWWFTTEKPAPTPIGEMPQVCVLCCDFLLIFFLVNFGNFFFSFLNCVMYFLLPGHFQHDGDILDPGS